MGSCLCQEVSYRLLVPKVLLQTGAAPSRLIFVFKQFAGEISTKQSARPSGMFPSADLSATPHICTWTQTWTRRLTLLVMPEGNQLQPRPPRLALPLPSLPFGITVAALVLIVTLAQEHVSLWFCNTEGNDVFTITFNTTEPKRSLAACYAPI